MASHCADKQWHSVAKYSLCEKARISLAPLPLSPSRFLFMTEGATVIFTDASRGDECSGLGYVITGDAEVADNKTLYGTYTSMEAEYHALMEALRVASLKSKHRKEVRIRTDCEPLVTKMTEEDRAEKWNERRRSFEWLVGKWDDYDLGSIGRLANQDADELAKQALDRGRRKV